MQFEYLPLGFVSDRLTHQGEGDAVLVRLPFATPMMVAPLHEYPR